MELPTSSPGTTDKGRVWRHWSNHIHHRTTMQTPPWPTNVPFRSSQMAPNVSFGLPMNLNYATNQTFERRTLRWFQLRWWTLSRHRRNSSCVANKGHPICASDKYRPVDPPPNDRTNSPLQSPLRKITRHFNTNDNKSTTPVHRNVLQYLRCTHWYTGYLVC